LSALEIGESAVVQGPEGHFVCKDEHAKHKIFIATGTGLAPIMSMVPDQLRTGGEGAQVHVLFGVRNEADLFWIDRFDRLQKLYPYFSHQITLSQPDQPTGWQGLTGRVTTHVPHHHLEAEYYLCGSLEMVKDVRKILVEKGVPMKQIHFEIF
jgi:ferredoxin-NADP reductase